MKQGVGIFMEFKDKLISIRKQFKLTQQQVADGVNVSRSVVAKWETGLVIPKENMIISLATFFNVPVTDLTTDDNEQAIKKESRKTNISLIILALIFIIIVLDLLDLLAINIIFAVISYIILCCAFLISIIKIKIPHKDIISFIVSIVIFLSFIITHFILCNNPYTYKYREVEGGVIITGYKNNRI
jgi:transcriptional regulator with XRE-family HTH domain